MTIFTWRSETLKALSATSECINARGKKVKDINDLLYRDLGKIFPLLFSHQADRAISFYDQIMVPAAKLAVKIQTCAIPYVFSIRKSPLCNFMPLILEHLTMFRLTEYRTGKLLKPDSAVVPDDRGVIGRFIMLLEPSLHRVNGKGDVTMLRLATFLVELNHPVGKRNKGLA